MKTLFLLSLLLVSYTLASLVREESYYLNAFTQFKRDYARDYVTPEEEQFRYTIFKDNVDWIDAHNQKKLSYRVKVNRFADMTNEEYREKYLKFRPSKDQNFRSMKGQPDNLMNLRDLPKTVDWRKKNAVTKIKDQGQCGSCWAFSTSGAIEGTNAIKTTTKIELSEQQIIDCSWGDPYDNEGCDGGDMRSAMQYIIDATGIELEKVYPYVDGVGIGSDKHRCMWTVTLKAASISGMVNVTEGNETALAVAIVINPVSVAIDASHKSFQYYQDGIYYEPSCGNKNDDLDHGVLAVGYGDGYYWVKNSWGTDWGDGGYIQMARNERNNCGIATYATYALP